jgi:hypothetical protein
MLCGMVYLPPYLYPHTKIFGVEMNTIILWRKQEAGKAIPVKVLGLLTCLL